MTAFTTLKTVTTDPMPSAMVSVAMAVNPGVRASVRSACRMSRLASSSQDERPRLPLLFLQRRDAAQVASGRQTRVVARHPAPQIFVLDNTEMRINLTIEFALGSSRQTEGTEPCHKASKTRHRLQLPEKQLGCRRSHGFTGLSSDRRAVLNWQEAAEPYIGLPLVCRRAGRANPKLRNGILARQG